MKRNSIAVFFSVFFFAVTAFAMSKLPWQEKETLSTDDVNGQLKFLSPRLNLSQDQQAKIKSIIEDQRFQTETIERNESLSPDVKARKITDLREQNNFKIRALLNDDQKSQFDEIQREMRVHAGHGNGQGFGSQYGQGVGIGQGHDCQMPDVEDHLQLLSGNLNLSPNQRAKLKVIIEDQLAQLQAIGTDGSLSTNDKRDKSRDLRETTALKVRDQLNDQQKRKFDELRKDTNERMKERRERGEDCSMIWMTEE